MITNVIIKESLIMKNPFNFFAPTFLLNRTMSCLAGRAKTLTKNEEQLF